ncbi:MAG: DNA polymerase III subunit delta' [Syntrophales bacterium]|nr:DNA polymerase III subunit delta' [Syntrophales bacterium]MDX9921647.1 DNA polymerase III subunit delta' [Syntrophales bacterium]
MNSTIMPFSNIYGHERQIALLNNSLAMNRVAQSYLFYGMAGLGKKTVAASFARALNCRGTERDSGEQCSSCRTIVSGNHPDVLRVVPRGAFIRIEDIRDVAKGMRFRPMEGRRRVVIIEDADRMNNAAANAFLKTLEEPSPDNVLIVITSRCESLPKTILSRCQKVRFNPLPPNAVEAYLRERLGLDEDEAKLLAAASGGSIGRILDRDKQTWRHVRDEIIACMVPGDATAEDGNPLAVIVAAQRFGEDRNEIALKLDLLKEWFRDALVLRENGRDGLLIHGDTADAAAICANTRSTRDILMALEAIDHARKGIERNGNRQLILEAMLFRIGASGAVSRVYESIQ